MRFIFIIHQTEESGWINFYRMCWQMITNGDGK